MLIDSTLLDNLTAEARRAPRLRMNYYDLRNSAADVARRMLSAMWPGTIIFEAKDGAYEPLAEGDILDIKC